MSWTALAERPLGWLLRTRRLPGVAVLCYHGVRSVRTEADPLPFAGLHVARSTFDRHCAALVRTCHPISLDDWRAARRGERPLPARPVLVTFDDGYRSVLTEALPVLERHGVPAVILLITGPIARGEMFWYDAVALAQGEAAVVSLKGASYDAWHAAVARVPRATSPDAAASPLAEDDVRALAAHPLIELGGHSDNHAILARAPRDRQATEISRCADHLLRWSGRPMRAFAYPNGQPDIDFTQETRALVRAAGVDHAFTTANALASVDGDPVMVPRFTMTAGVTSAHLLNRLARIWT